jgi:hypothetical protein
VVFLLSVSEEAAMTRPHERPEHDRPQPGSTRDRPARKRMRRLDILLGCGVVIAALAATWGLIQPEIEHT